MVKKSVSQVVDEIKKSLTPGMTMPVRTRTIAVALSQLSDADQAKARDALNQQGISGVPAIGPAGQRNVATAVANDQSLAPQGGGVMPPDQQQRLANNQAPLKPDATQQPIGGSGTNTDASSGIDFIGGRGNNVFPVFNVPEGLNLPGAQRTQKSGDSGKTRYQISSTQLLQDLYQRTDIPQLQQQMADAGFLTKKGYTPGVVDGATLIAYKSLLEGVGAAVEGGQDVTVEDVLAAHASALANSTAKDKTRVTTSTNITDPLTAGTLIDNMLAKATGRHATPELRQQFMDALNAYQQAHPRVETDTVDPDTGLTTSAKVVDKSADPNAFAQQYVQQGAIGTDANTFQAATSYYQAALAALGPGGK